MLFDEKFRKLRASFSRHAPAHQPTTPVSVDDIALEIPSLPIATILATDAETLAARRALPKNLKLEDLFVTQSWHRPYAEALLETDPSNLPYLIAAAERAILDRYLELELAPVPTDELVDLGHAIEALSQIKSATTPED
jgi:hypothetical protein